MRVGAKYGYYHLDFQAEGPCHDITVKRQNDIIFETRDEEDTRLKNLSDFWEELDNIRAWIIKENGGKEEAKKDPLYKEASNLRTTSGDDNYIPGFCETYESQRALWRNRDYSAIASIFTKADLRSITYKVRG